MSETVIQQLYSFLIFFISGAIIGIFFDIFRIIRKIFKISNIHTYIEDIIFGLITGFFLIFITFIYNNGSIRFYMFIAIFLGILLYLKLISKYFIKINVTIFGFINQVICKLVKIIMYPIKCIFNLFKKLNKPFMCLIINIRKIVNKNNKNKWKKSQKMLIKKKDFNI